MFETFNISIDSIARDIGLKDTSILTYRPLGRQVRNTLMERILECGTGFVLLNFAGIKLCDVSFVDETVIELQLNYLSKGDICLCVLNITEPTLENLNAALALKEQRGRKVQILIKKDGSYSYLGKLESNLSKTFHLVVDQGELTARDVATHYDIAINSASNRLKKLYDQRLVLRREEINEQGKQHIYFLPRLG